jgi:hypothetical protein
MILGKDDADAGVTRRAVRSARTDRPKVSVKGHGIKVSMKGHGIKLGFRRRSHDRANASISCGKVRLHEPPQMSSVETTDP